MPSAFKFEDAPENRAAAALRRDVFMLQCQAVDTKISARSNLGGVLLPPPWMGKKAEQNVLWKT